MKSPLRLGLYVAIVIVTVIFGAIFAQTLRRANAAAAATRAAPAPGNRAVKPATPAKSAKTPATQVPPPGSTSTNEPAPPTNETESGTAATEPATSTNEPSPSELTPEQEPLPVPTAAAASRSFHRLVIWGLLTVAGMVSLGVLLAFDIARHAGRRASDVMFEDFADELNDTEYETIEKMYGTGDYLETVRMLREFLKRHPRAIHAQLRIAEIYEKDLKNPLASALEYEEVLKLPLEPGRRGWTAIHLVNLYNHLDKPDRAVALMRRIVVECPDTPAAGKAKERLAAMGEEFDEPPPPAEQGGGSLPPGFKPKR